MSMMVVHDVLVVRKNEQDSESAYVERRQNVEGDLLTFPKQS